MNREIMIIDTGNISKDHAVKIAELEAEGHIVTILTPEEAKKLKIDEMITIIENHKPKNPKEEIFKITPMPELPEISVYIPERRNLGKGRDKMQWRGKKKR